MGTMSARCVFPWFEILSLFLALKCWRWRWRCGFLRLHSSRSRVRGRLKTIEQRIHLFVMILLLYECQLCFARAYSRHRFRRLFSRGRIFFFSLKTGRPSPKPSFFSFVFVVDDWGPLKKFFFLNKS